MEEEYENSVLEFYINESELMDGARYIIDFFKKKNLKIGLASSSPMNLISTFLNKFNLAALLNEDWTVPASFPCDQVASSSFRDLQENLPRWTMFICLQGFARLPEEKIAYEEKALRETCEATGVELLTTIPSCIALDK
jgi:hypothetical protein